MIALQSSTAKQCRLPENVFQIIILEENMISYGRDLWVTTNGTNSATERG